MTAAKLNQVVPTMHWHGLDQIRREETEKMKKNEQESNLLAIPDDTRSSTMPPIPPPSTSSTPSTPSSNATLLKQTIWHFLREMSKVEEEMEYVTCKLKKEGNGDSGLAYPWRDLDSSLDAMVYLFYHLSSLSCSLFYLFLFSLLYRSMRVRILYV